jgi:2-(1,2-epoxy-1,2-dihydrophenyl)acetyl-CoA isomerase
MSASATMTAGYVRRGLSPDAGVSYFLPRHLGLARAADILLTGRDVDAAEAERIGLVALVSPDADFTAAVSRYASRLAAGAPVAQALTKRLLHHALDQPLDAQLREELVHIKYCFTTSDVGEAMTAFREKRTPSFKGR